MKVHVLQHIPFEGIGSIEPWLAAREAAITHTQFHEPDWTLPDPRTLDLIIIMGGPMSVNDEAELPWLVDEKQFVRDAMQAGTAVLGICLGAQLVASALGASVYPGPQREIGWFDIEAAPGQKEGTFRFPPRAKVFHWHGETFDLPAGATLLASSAACQNQAFQIGRNVIGLQCHLETTPESAASIIAACCHELVEGPFVQPEATLRFTPASAYAEVNKLMAQVLEYLTVPQYWDTASH